MHPSLRVVTSLPLDQLWDATGPLPVAKRRDVGRAEIAGLLQAGRVRFVVASLGGPLTWVPAEDCYRYWKADVNPRLVEPAADRFRPDDYPGSYCYCAAEWGDVEGHPVVVLETHH